MISPLALESVLEPAALTSIAQAIRSDRSSALGEVLGRQLRRGAFNDPSLYPSARGDRYTRKLLYRDPDGAFIVTGMTWLPGQCAAIHDHSGLWGAEIVTVGTMHERSYVAAEKFGERARLVERGVSTCTVGSIGIISAPFDIHSFGNGGSSIAHTVHVYSGEPVQAQSYAPDGAQWYRIQSVALSYDD